MNHRPFENWLLDDQPLTREQKRDLLAHLRTCPACTALAETGLALRSARPVAPVSGFAARWQARLALARKTQRRRARLGVVILVVVGLVLLAWLIGPAAIAVAGSPADWIAAWARYLVYIVVMLQTLNEAGSVVLRVLPGLLPGFGWMMLVSAVSGLAMLWTVSIWRLTRLPRGV